MRPIPTGVLPVLVTPFKSNSEIDTVALHDEVDFILEQGVDGVVLGMVSEWLRLSHEERDLLTRETCAAVAGRVAVVASVGAESLHTAIRGAKNAAAAGATALMAIPPIGTACDDDELHRYFAGIISAVDIPLVVQDASGYLGRSLSIELQAGLYHEFEDRALFKPEAKPIGPRLTALLDATGQDAKVYEGTGGIALVDSFRRGVVGTMPGPDLVWAIVALWQALAAGDNARVDQIQGPLSSIVSMQNGLDSFVAVQKHLLRRQGVLTETLSRGPVGFQLDRQAEREADRLFDLLRHAVESVATS